MSFFVLIPQIITAMKLHKAEIVQYEKTLNMKTQQTRENMRVKIKISNAQMKRMKMNDIRVFKQ